jgi:hypothetical protein
MVFKPFKGGQATVGYQMRNKTAKVLIGNPRQTDRLIHASKFAQPYCGMTLSFEEEVSPADEGRILEEFVALIRGGLEPDSLDILVVRHTDKKNKKTGNIRTDYHITTVETELRTGKHITIYHYIKDHDIFYAWERMVNIRHNFSRPDDPARRQTTNIPRRLPKDKKDALAMIDEAVQAELIAGRIKNRSDVIAFLKKSKFAVNREGKNYLGIEDAAGNKLRLRGIFYEPEFDSARLAESAAGTPPGPNAGSPENLGEAEKRFSKLFAGRVSKFQKLYRRNRKKIQMADPVGPGGDSVRGAVQCGLNAGERLDNAPDEPSSPSTSPSNGKRRPVRTPTPTEIDSPGTAGDGSPRSNLYRTQKDGVNYDEQTDGIDEPALDQIGRLGARSRAAAERTTAVLHAATAAMGAKSLDLDDASSGVATAVANFVQIVTAVDRAIKFARNPLRFLAEFLIEKLRPRPNPPRIRPPSLG